MALTVKQGKKMNVFIEDQAWSRQETWTENWAFKANNIGTH